MQKATIVGERQAAIVQVPDPQAKEDWVVVKIETSPMCTEYKTFIQGRPTENLGHEAAGEVVEIAQPGRFQVGTRVVVMPQNSCGCCGHCLSGEYIHCQNNRDFAGTHGTNDGAATMAQYMLKPDYHLIPIPDGISYDHASMACCGLGPTFGALQRNQAEATDIVLITGLGPVGLGGVINTTHRGARVIGVDNNQWRAEKAIELGAEAIIDPTQENALQQILDLTHDGRGVNHALDCSGVPAAHPSARHRRHPPQGNGLLCGRERQRRNRPLCQQRHDPQGPLPLRFLAL